MMRTNSKCALVTLGFLLATHAGLATAHTQAGALGTAAVATDYYQVTCTDDGSGPPASLLVRVRDDAPVAAPIVSVLVHKGLLARNGSDPVDGDTGLSFVAVVNGGAGVYNVFVSKTAAGVENYTLTLHCMSGLNGGGVHTGTTVTLRQNQ